MDAEGLKSLGWIVLWGLLFFVMMRYGCGAHIMGGHGHHGGHGKQGGSGGEKDPVCGMAVDPEKAAGASVHAGKTYYFCSTSCRDKFEKEPAKYAAARARDEHQHGGHHHG
jgi:YHS domain-containing protein